MGHAIYLTGSAQEVGTLQGRLQKAFLQERAERMERMMHAAQVSKSTFTARVATFEKCLLDATPHWLDEANAIVNAAGLERWQLLLWNMALPELALIDPLPAPLTLKSLQDARAGDTGIVNPYEAQGTDPAMGEGECTTFFALGDSTLAGETLLHKNRDTHDELQNVYIKHLNGFQRFVGSGDLGNLGTAHLHSEALFAGANNTGSPVAPEEYQLDALNDCHLLRYIGEHCAGLDDIVDCVKELQSRNFVAGSNTLNLGVILLFADAERGLIIEATSKHLQHQWFEGDDIASRTNHFEFPEMQGFIRGLIPGSEVRAKRVNELLEPLDGLMDISTCGEIGRDRETAPHAICRIPSDGMRALTVSTSTSTISANDERRCQTHFHNGNPIYCPPIIVSPLDLVSDSDQVSGEYHEHWRGFRGWA